MSLYLLINIVIVFIPMLVIFYKPLGLPKKLPAYLISLLISGTIFIAWDIYAVRMGDWSFNFAHVLTPRIFGLPIEEILFFITVPFSCIVIYESISHLVKEKIYAYDKGVALIPAFIFIALSFVFDDHSYTSMALLASSAVILAAYYFMPDLLKSKRFLIFITFCLVPFIIVNLILTAVPVIIYKPEAILGIKLITIPVEDFFFCFSMLTLYLLMYLKFRKA